jgi:hypothetical protein
MRNRYVQALDLSPGFSDFGEKEGYGRVKNRRL